MGIEKVPFEFQWRAFEVMESTPRHTYLVCTKRPHNMAFFIAEWFKKKPVLNNCFLGVTIENQEMADRRIPELLKCRPFKLFLSVEPLLSNIDLSEYFRCANCKHRSDMHISTYHYCKHCPCNKYIPPIDCVIAGCESGHHARETKIEWIKNLREQCIDAGVPLWVKQLKVDGKMVYDHPLSTIKREELWQ